MLINSEDEQIIKDTLIKTLKYKNITPIQAITAIINSLTAIGISDIQSKKIADEVVKCL